MAYKTTYCINPKLHKEMRRKKIITNRGQISYAAQSGLGWVNNKALERTMNELTTMVTPQ